MTLTIATRWQVTFRVQPLARVTMPVTGPMPARQENGPDLLAIAQTRQMRDEREMREIRWQAESLMSARRIF